MMISKTEVVDVATVALVVLCGALAGHYASEGMNLLQWAGAATAVLGSVTIAVAVRVWPLTKAPAKAKAKTPQED